VIAFRSSVSHGAGFSSPRVSLTSSVGLRLGDRGHAELVIPVETLWWVHRAVSGLADLAIDGSYVLATGSLTPIVAAAGMTVKLPTGDLRWSFGEGVAAIQPYFAAGASWRRVFIQTELRLLWPVHQVDPEENHRRVAYNLAFGRDLSAAPSTWTLSAEVNGESDVIAMTPQVRKGLTMTGSPALAVGVRIPLTSLPRHHCRVIQWVALLTWDYRDAFRRRAR
jgi:hypothetical protein